MPPQKRRTAAAAKRSPSVQKQAVRKAAKPKAASRSKTQALAISDKVRREPIGSMSTANPLMAFEPLRRSMVDRQIALIQLVMAWSPAQLFVDHQAALWGGIAGGKTRGTPADRKPHTKRRPSV